MAPGCLEALRGAGFPPHLGGASEGAPPAAAAGPGADEDALGTPGDGGGESGQLERIVLQNREYDYLLRMPLLSLTAERATRLEAELERKRVQVDELQKTSELALWKRELEALRQPLAAHIAARFSEIMATISLWPLCSSLKDECIHQDLYLSFLWSWL